MIIIVIAISRYKWHTKILPFLAVMYHTICKCTLIFALCRNGYFISACLLIVLHDFLDHLDGIVAKVQRKMYGPRSSDPLLGGFLDAFCDKVCGHGAIPETDMLE